MFKLWTSVMIVDLTPQSIERLGKEINAARGPELKLSQKEVEALAFGIRTALVIVGQPNLLYEMEIKTDDITAEKQATYYLPRGKYINANLTSRTEPDAVRTTLVFTNTREDQGIASLVARVIQDPVHFNVSSFTACIVTRETIPTDLPMLKKMAKKFMKSTGIEAFIRDLKQEPATDITSTTIHFPNSQGTFDIVSVNPGIGKVDLPAILSTLSDMDGTNLTEKFQEITSSLLQE